MTIKDYYNQTGANYDEAISRLMNDALMKKFVIKFFEEDPTYASLCDAMAAKDTDAAFKAAHTLKGVALNLALSNIAVPASALTEDLRAGGSDKAAELFEQVKAEYAKSLSLSGQVE